MPILKSEIWQQLNGIICIYKPPRMSWKTINNNIRQNVCRELNGSIPTKGVPYNRNPLVVGPWHTMKRMSSYSTLIDHITSGVAVVGIRGGWRSARDLKWTNPIRVYHVRGRLGEASDEFFATGKIRERATYDHVTRPIVDKVVASVQAAYQRSMFDACGVNLQSQAAYELAVKGLLKPVDPNIPVFYGIKCIHFEPPDFTIEVQCINETSLYLMRLIHLIGIRLNSVALCTAVRLIRYGPFTVEHALVKHRWKLQDILENIDMCTQLYITEAVSDRHSIPKLITSPDESWEEAERTMLTRNIIQKKTRRKFGEEKDKSLNSGGSKLEASEIPNTEPKLLQV